MSSKNKVQLSDFDFEEDEDVSPLQTIAKKSNFKQQPKTSVSPQALDSREIGVRSAADKPLDSREIGVRSAAEENKPKSLGVRQAADKPLDSREIGVRQFENSALDINLLVGKQKKLLTFVFNECKKIGDLETNFINSDDLKILLDQSAEDLRNLILEVKKKGFFENIVSKNSGRIGLRKFKISRTIYQQFLTSALDSREIGVRQAADKPLDKPLDGTPYSSSILNNNITITEESSHWVHSLNQEHFPQTVLDADFRLANNIKQAIIRTTITEADFWMNLSAFDYDINDPHCKKKPNAKILYSCFLNGNPYTSERYKQALSHYKKLHEETKIEFEDYSQKNETESNA